MWYPLSGLFSLPVPGKRQMGTSASLLVARLELALGIPAPIPVCPLAISPSLSSVDHSIGGCVGLCPLLAWMHPWGLCHFPLCREDVGWTGKGARLLLRPPHFPAPAKPKAVLWLGHWVLPDPTRGAVYPACLPILLPRLPGCYNGLPHANLCSHL